MPKIGDWVFDSELGTNVQILDKTDVWGYITYKVFDPNSDSVYRLAEDQIRTDNASVYYDENYLRYVTLLSKIKNETASGFLSSISNGIIPLPHQFHALNRVLKTNNIRYILADEVGLGKTIEAGMIVKELKARGLVQRVLVVCPTGLVTQWASEMQEKFNERYHVILPSDYETIRRLTDSDDIYSQYDQVISPMDSIKPMEKRNGWDEEQVKQYNEERIYSIINSGWDLVIIDEAHRVAGSSGDVARHKLGKLLSQASPYLLLLTATPHNGKKEPFLRLVRLLDSKAFPNAQSIVKEQVAPYLIRTEKREAIDNKGNLLFKKRITHLVSLHWDERHSKQKDLYELVSSYVAKTYNKALRDKKRNMCLIFLLIIMQRMLTSSTAAVRHSLEQRLDILTNHKTYTDSITEDSLDEINIENGLDEAVGAISFNNQEEIEELEQLIIIAKQAESQYSDVKIEALIDILGKIQCEDNNLKVIIFTEFVATQNYLKSILESKGYLVTILNGNMSIEERDLAMHDFKLSTNIFISTDAGGEGLNLQFSNIIINYDLPWNPMKIEQRCGRADRIGQKKDVHVYNFIVSDTVESRVRDVLEEKLSIIFDELGVDKYSDVLDSEMAEIDFTNLYLHSIEKPSKIEEHSKPLMLEIKHQIQNTVKYKDIIQDDKDLSHLVGVQNDFDVDEALCNMLKYYSKWKGYNTNICEHIPITDSSVTKHLHSDIQFDRKSPLMSVSIQNFPNEAGYFMLWELSISNKSDDKRIIPIFVNHDNVLRPIAGKRLMEVFLDPSSTLAVNTVSSIDSDMYDNLEKIAINFTYDAFIEMKNKHIEKNQENYDKYIYALKLREEAAKSIGIENIRVSKLLKLSKERENIEKAYFIGQKIYPEFKLKLLIQLEAD